MEQSTDRGRATPRKSPDLISWTALAERYAVEGDMRYAALCYQWAFDEQRERLHRLHRGPHTREELLRELHVTRVMAFNADRHGAFSLITALLRRLEGSAEL